MTNLNSVISERSQTQKVPYCMMSFMRNSRKGKTTVIESRSVVGGKGEVRPAEGPQGAWRGDGNVLYQGSAN